MFSMADALFIEAMGLGACGWTDLGLQGGSFVVRLPDAMSGLLQMADAAGIHLQLGPGGI